MICNAGMCDGSQIKRGHTYLPVVVDHDTGRLVWAAPGRDKLTLIGKQVTVKRW